MAISFISAFEFDNVQNIKESYGLAGYKDLEIKNAFGLGKLLWSGTLNTNTDNCLKNCNATQTITLHEPGVLIEDVIYERIFEDGSREETEVRNEKIYANGDIYQPGTEIEAGTYEVLLDVEKNPRWTIDWMYETQGETLNEWAIWFGGADYENSTTMDVSSSSAGQTTRFGIRFETKNNVKLINATRWTGVTCPTAYLYNRTGVAAGDVLATETFSGDTATFNFDLVAGNEYFLVCDDGGGSYTSHWDSTVSFPFDTGNATIHSRVDIGTDESTANSRNFRIFVTSNLEGLVALNSPANNFISPSEEIEFNCSATVTGGATLVNGSLLTNETGSWAVRNVTTGLSTAGENLTWNRTFNEGDVFDWTCKFSDSDGDEGFSSTNRTASVDTTAPIITINNPSGTEDFGRVGGNETLNWTITDINLDTCWFEYNNTNTTIQNCFSGVTDTLSFELIDQLNLTVYANDSGGLINSSFTEWDYKVFQTNVSISDKLFVSQIGNYNIKFTTAGSSLSSPKLIFNSVETDGTLTDNLDGTFNISATRSARAADVGNANVSFKLTVDGSDIVTSNNSQTIQNIFLTNCTNGNSSSYLHINFKDETDLTDLNASVSSSTWNYWLEDSDQFRTFSFTHTPENETYDLCLDPNNLTYTMDIEFPYFASTYPQRIFRADDLVFTNTTTNRTLYLLGAAEGFFTRYAGINSLTGSAVPDVEVTVQKEILGVPTTVSQGQTDATGLLTLWLDPDDLHSFTFIKTGFQVNTFSIRPTSPDTYQIAMVPTTGAAGDVGNGTDIVSNLSFDITPSQLTLEENNSYTFSFNVTKTPAPVSTFMELSENGTVIFTSTQIGNGIISTMLNVTNRSSIDGVFRILTSNETLEFTKSWTIVFVESGDFSLDAWLNFGNELSMTSLWWSLFRYLVIMGSLIAVAAAFYYTDPFDSSIASLSVSIVVVWMFSSFGWMTINTPGTNPEVDKNIIAALYSIAMISFMAWRYKTQ